MGIASGPLLEGYFEDIFQVPLPLDAGLLALYRVLNCFFHDSLSRSFII